MNKGEPMKPFNEKEPRVADFENSNWGFHGDVVLEKIEMPGRFEAMEKLDDNILAHGEHTGHCHKLFGDDIDLREDQQTKVKYLRLVKPACLKHQEHDPVTLPPGDYRIGIQKEYDHFSKKIREVAD